LTIKLRAFILYKVKLLDGANPMNTVNPKEKAIKIEIAPAMWEKLQVYGQLHDFYGQLLTDRQNMCFTMHYLEDLTMAEVGEALGITPQAVADQIKRTVKILQKYEEKLGLIQHWHNQQAQLKDINLILDELIKAGHPVQKIKEMLEVL